MIDAGTGEIKAGQRIDAEIYPRRMLEQAEQADRGHRAAQRARDTQSLRVQGPEPYPVKQKAKRAVELGGNERRAEPRQDRNVEHPARQRQQGAQCQKGGAQPVQRLRRPGHDTAWPWGRVRLRSVLLAYIRWSAACTSSDAV